MNCTNKKFICPYCGEETEGSDEHIIPRSLGGALRSFRVCCQRCNNQLGEQVDGPFVKMFDPLRARMGALNGFGTFLGPIVLVLQQKLIMKIGSMLGQ